MTIIRITVLTALLLLAASSAAQTTPTSTESGCCKSCNLPNASRCKKPQTKSTRKSILLSCTERLADFHDNSALTPGCVGVAEGFAYDYIAEHPELLLLAKDAHLKIEPPESVPVATNNTPASSITGYYTGLATLTTSVVTSPPPPPCGYDYAPTLGADGKCHAEILLIPKEWTCMHPPDKANVLLCTFKPKNP